MSSLLYIKTCNAVKAWILGKDQVCFYCDGTTDFLCNDQWAPQYTEWGFNATDYRGHQMYKVHNITMVSSNVHTGSGHQLASCLMVSKHSIPEGKVARVRNWSHTFTQHHSSERFVLHLHSPIQIILSPVTSLNS